MQSFALYGEINSLPVMFGRVKPEVVPAQLGAEGLVCDRVLQRYELPSPSRVVGLYQRIPKDSGDWLLQTYSSTP